jgi:hypothetical protein
MVGALISAWLRQTAQRDRAVLTHHLCGINDVAARKSTATPMINT